MDEEKIDYDELNSLIYNFIYFAYGDPENSIVREELDIDNQLCDIIINNYNFKNLKEKTKFKKKMDLNKTIELSKQFLNTIKKEYAAKLNENIEYGKILFPEYDNVMELGYVEVDEHNNKIILVKLLNNIRDIFSLTHEEIHDVVYNVDSITDTSNILCEVPTILSELLLADYVKDKMNKNELINYKKEFLQVYAFTALNFKLQFLLIDEVITNGYIDKISLANIVLKIIEICNDESLAFDILYRVRELSNEDMSFYFQDLRYINGIVLASYLHDKILNNPKLIKCFSGYNETYFDKSIPQVFKSIGLDVVDEDLLKISEDSYNELEKSFQKELKRVW
ncbi:MAG TPA: hypothetical protein PLV83_01955 [Bacilli bacterium]|nr:hypothetical protein [Bacilli bacterium]